MNRHLIVILIGSSILAGCGEEPPPRSVDEFVDNPILLEAVMVRCSENRSKTRYDHECVNARLAVSRIQAREEAARKAELEASSERKRQALRRTQAAAAEARRRAAEAERRREEAEYLSQFGVQPPAPGETEQTGPEAADTAAGSSGNEAGAVTTPEPATESVPTDLETVREELQRRNDQDGD